MALASRSMEGRLLSRPFPVHWAGWETNTFKLQQAGWQLAVEYEIYRDGYRLLLRNEQMRMCALSSSLQLHQGFTDPYAHHDRLPPFQMQYAACNLEVMRVPESDLSNFQQIDAKPAVVSHEIQSVEDMNIFNIPLRRGEEVMIESANMDVIDHLEAIKALQSEKQKEIRARIIRERDSRGVDMTRVNNVAPASDVIVSLVEYRERAAN